jgi:DNA mismatch repair protein MSH4
VQVKSERVIAMSYQLKDGVVEDDHYGFHLVCYKFTTGIRLAKLTTLPESILVRATQVSEALAARARQRSLRSNTHVLGERRRLILQLQETLKQTSEGSMDDESMARWLRRVQNRFVEEFGSIG